MRDQINYRDSEEEKREMFQAGKSLEGIIFKGYRLLSLNLREFLDLLKQNASEQIKKHTGENLLIQTKMI